MWYAVQTDSHDSWDYGSYDLNEAIEMLLADDDFQLIAVIDEETNFCVDEITRRGALFLSESHSFEYLEV